MQIIGFAYLVFLFCITARGDEQAPTEDEKVVMAMDRAYSLAIDSIRLAKVELPVFKARVSDDDGFMKVVQLQMRNAEKVPDTFVREFKSYVENKDFSRVRSNVWFLFWLDNFRAVDGVLVAEVLAGSSQADKLMNQYTRCEAALNLFWIEYESWILNK